MTHCSAAYVQQAMGGICEADLSVKKDLAFEAREEALKRGSQKHVKAGLDVEGLRRALALLRKLHDEPRESEDRRMY